MMQGAESGKRQNVARPVRFCGCSWVRRVLLQPQMGPVVVIVANVFRQQALQVTLIERNHVVKQVPTAAPDPTLATPFCQGLRNEVLTALSPTEFAALLTAVPNLASRSRIKYL